MVLLPSVVFVLKKGMYVALPPNMLEAVAAFIAFEADKAQLAVPCNEPVPLKSVVFKNPFTVKSLIVVPL